MEILKFFLFLLVLNYVNGQEETFQNPILSSSSPDPFVLRKFDTYWMVLSDSHTKMFVLQSDILTDWRDASRVQVYEAPEGMDNLFAPEMHFIKDQLYIHFAMDNHTDAMHRMYVVKAEDSSKPQGSYSEAKRIVPLNEDYFAIDGTILETLNGDLYYIWAGWPEAELPCDENGENCRYGSNLYIASMSDPETISSERKMLRRPLRDWEGSVVEAPQFFRRGDKTFMIYSASSTWDETYAVGLMFIYNDADPMELSNWKWFNTEPVFWKNVEENVHGPGHASITSSPDGTESWIVYHAMTEEHIGTNRTARTQKIHWNEYNWPIFPRPNGFHAEHQIPSGQKKTTEEISTTEINRDNSATKNSSYILLAVIVQIAFYLNIVDRKL